MLIRNWLQQVLSALPGVEVVGAAGPQGMELEVGYFLDRSRDVVTLLNVMRSMAEEDR